jgi:hypothetical protein
MMSMLLLVLSIVLISAISAASFPLDSVLTRGDSCVGIVWTPDTLNTRQAWFIRCGSACTGSDTVCLHSDFIAGRQYRGAAYSYGGDDPYLLFRERLTRGDIAGSHLCHYTSCGDPSDSVTGIDCSAFTCWAWNEPRQSTSAMVANSAYSKVPRSQIAAGDALVRGGSHSVMIVDQDDSTHFVIQEATGTPINGCRERLIDISDTYWDQYTPLRNPKITSSAIKKPDAKPANSPSSARVVRNGRFDFSGCRGWTLVRVFTPDGSLIFEYQPIKKEPPLTVASGIFIVQATLPGGTVTTFTAVAR